MKTILVGLMIFAAATGLHAYARTSTKTSAFDFLASVNKTASPDQGAVQFIPVGDLITGTVKDGKLQVTVVRGVTLVLRSDGTVGWILSEEAEKEFKKEADKGIKMPPTPYDSGKR